VRAPQDEVGNRRRVLDPDGQEHGNAVRLEPRGPGSCVVMNEC
jgi:hypothetical protein